MTAESEDTTQQFDNSFFLGEVIEDINSDEITKNDLILNSTPENRL